MKRISFAALLLVCSALTPVRAFEGYALELGRSYPFGANLVRIHALTQGRERQLSARWQMQSFWEISVGYWYNRSDGPNTPNVWEIAVAPVFQLQRKSDGAILPYLEFASGPRLISEKNVNQRREFGGHFQFGSHLGVGARFGAKRAYDLSFRVQHLSNARLKQPNDGINFGSLRLSYRW